MSILVLILFSIGVFLIWKFEVGSKIPRILVSFFFGILVLGNLIKPSSTTIAQEGLYKKEGNVVLSYLYLIPDTNRKSRDGGSLGRGLFGPSSNKDTFSIIKGSYFLAKDSLITFKWEEPGGPDTGIYKKDEIVITCLTGGDVIYKLVKD